MSKRIKIKEPKEDTRLRFESFYKRWNIDLDEKQRWQNFKNRVLNSYTYFVGKTLRDNHRSECEFFEILGIHEKTYDNVYVSGTVENGFERSPAYNYFKQANTRDFILGLEVVFWMKNIEVDLKDFFWMDIITAKVTTGVPLGLKRTDSIVIFYPEGAKLLDEKLVNDNLDWLMDYPKSYEAFKGALQDFETKGKERDVVDKLRLSLELLFRNILQNKKSLENQEKDIGNYLKTKNVSIEISNMFWKMLDYYNKYQNNKAKHENNVPTDEVEFILYLTGTFMRFLLTR